MTEPPIVDDRLQVASLNSAPIVFASIDVNGVIERLEGGLVAQLRLRPAKWVGTRIHDLYEQDPALIRAFEAASTGCTAQAVIHLLSGHDIEFHFSAIRDSDGEIIGVVMIGTDVTTRMGAQRILNSIAEGTSTVTGSEFFESLAKNIAVALDVPYVVITECQGRQAQSIRTLSFWCEGQINANIEYDVKDTPCEAVLKKGPQFFASAVQKAFPQDRELVDMSVEGYFGTPLRDEQGNVLGHLAILSKRPLDPAIETLPAIQIFADRACAELRRQYVVREIRDNEVQTQAILNNHVDAVVVHADDKIMFANQRFRSLIKAQEFDSLSNWLQTDSNEAVFHSDVCASDGSITPVECQSQSIQFHGHQAQLLVLRDISQRLKNERDRELLRSQLAQVGRLSMMGEMASGIAHEVNQPLTAIANYTNATRLELSSQEPPSPATIVDTLNQIEDQAILAGKIIRSLRTLAQKSEPGHRPVDANRLIRGLIDLILPNARSQNAKIELMLADELPPFEGDSIEIQQVVMNLVRNAMDQLRMNETDEKRIRIETSNDQHRVYICVRHDGANVSEERADQMFQPFNTNKPSDFDLGMSVCRSIIESHHGEIMAKPQSTGGVSMTIQLPILHGEHT